MVALDVVAESRYNHRIKTYTRDMNAVKKASSDSSRVRTHFSRLAVESFWPDRVADMEALLLGETTADRPNPDPLKSHSRYETVVSFRYLVVGAVCVWQECWYLLQTCRYETVNKLPYIDEVTESLGKLKKDFIEDVDKRRYRRVALHIQSLQSTYIFLQAQRMSIFIKNPRLMLILSDICSSYSLHQNRSMSFDRLEHTNTQLRENFRIYQRDNIEDFLEHLDSYFRPNLKETLEKKTWLVCEQGQQYVSLKLFNASVFTAQVGQQAVDYYAPAPSRRGIKQ